MKLVNHQSEKTKMHENQQIPIAKREKKARGAKIDVCGWQGLEANLQNCRITTAKIPFKVDKC